MNMMKKIAFMQFLITSVHDTLLKINSPEVFLLCTKQSWGFFFMKGFVLNGFFPPLVYIILLPSPSSLMDNKHILLQYLQDGMHSK